MKVNIICGCGLEARNLRDCLVHLELATSWKRKLRAIRQLLFIRIEITFN